MLDVGFSELLLIAMVALVVIGPKDLPVVIRHVARFVRELRGFYAGMKRQMNVVMEEAGLNDVHQQVSTIIDLNGAPQKAYDVTSLHELSENPSPNRGEVGRGALAADSSQVGASGAPTPSLPLRGRE